MEKYYIWMVIVGSMLSIFCIIHMIQVEYILDKLLQELRKKK
jgi:hypothetical protein